MKPAKRPTPNAFLAAQPAAARDKTALARLLKPKLTAREVIRKMVDEKIRLSEIARASQVTANVLRLHVFAGQPMSPRNAKKLERWSKGVISSVKMFVQDEVG